MRQFRYRTAVLAGPWRPSEAAALDDAVRAGQAALDEAEAAGWRWIVPGQIEARKAAARG